MLIIEFKCLNLIKMFINLENILKIIFWNCCINVISKKKNVIILLCNVIIYVV